MTGCWPWSETGQAKACADTWAHRDALTALDGDVSTALRNCEDRQLRLGRTVVERSRRMGQRSQIEDTMIPGDPTRRFGLETIAG